MCLHGLFFLLPTSLLRYYSNTLSEAGSLNCLNWGFFDRARCVGIVVALFSGDRSVLQFVSVEKVLVCIECSCCVIHRWKIVFWQCCRIAQEQRYISYSIWLGFCSCLLILQKKPPRENGHKQISSSSTGCLSSPNATVQSPKHEWKIIASEKTSSKYMTRARFVFNLAVLEEYCQFNILN